MKESSKSAIKKRRIAQEGIRRGFLATGKELPDFLQTEEESDCEEWDRREFEIDDDEEEGNFASEDYLFDWLDEEYEGSSSYKGIGDAYLWDAMPVTELSKLVGWATHFDGANRNSTSVHNIRINEGKAMAHTNKLHRMVNPVNVRCAVATVGIPTCVKPWIHMPSPPPKPSHLIFLSQCAERKLKQTEENIQKRAEEARSLMRLDHIRSSKKVHSDDSSSFLSHCLSSSDDDSDYNTFFKSFVKSKTMEHRSVRRPKGFHNRGKDESQSQSNEATKALNVFMTMDKTALISVGVMIEEAMTAMMLPLAREHVAHCRRLEAREERVRDCCEVRDRWPEWKKQQVILGKVKDSSFVDWTLPPICAIANLSRKHIDRGATSPFRHAYLSSSLPPSMTLKNTTTKRTKEEISGLVTSKDTDEREGAEQKAIDHWGDMHGFNMDFISKNTNLFQIFLDNLKVI